MIAALAGARGRAGGSGYGLPYALPTAAPYNAPVPCVTPSPDGSGSQMHPDVVDFGAGRKWRGFRFWMGCTPFPGRNDDYENPCLLVSNDGFHWQVPAGLTNPIYPAPTAPLFNSDIDLEYDPRTDELVMIYREKLYDTTQQVFLARSPDGVTWPHRPAPLNWTRPEGTGQVLSPCLIRRGEGDWWLFGVFERLRTLIYYTATTPEGAWSGPFTASSVPQYAWHLGMIWHDGAFRALMDIGPMYQSNPDGLKTGSSTDGHNWTWAAGTALDLAAAPAWDSTEIYRATLAPHENGTHYRVWYSADGPQNFRTGYTVLPASLWPTPA